ncbi:XRE family transcriptional regulator [Streptomyces sp. Ru73]|uniref:helix-turn-helix domain-containing protein n=1 Tax=Streptomyces sp. Ru73 TaxID=2080748 RepID=UPI000CDD5DC3|nr:XRE family transcriptional regulator [Streptomyces sp. Ru73]POX40903.1 XRE family transcriptional regulator [Streptomyces sp. Ru73]
MPRWRALPDELDPQVREFADQLRRLVDRSGLSISAVADRTGYSKTSWERYLNGRLLAPRRAVLALAEVTGAHAGHLTTMWELAERAWSRAEMRHDVTMEAIRVAEARAALGEFGPAPDTARGPGKRSGTKGAGRAATAPPEAYVRATPSEAPAATQVPHQRASETGEAPAPAASSAPSAASAPPASSAPSAADVEAPAPAAHAAPASASAAPPSSPAPPVPPSVPGHRPPAAGPAAGPDPERRRRATMFVTGVVGALLLIAAAVLLLGSGDGGQQAKPAPAAPTPSQQSALPSGVKCAGAGCVGKDPEEMGCGGDQATTPSRGVMGSALIEVRYSKVCGAAWARLTGAAQGDRASVTSGGHTEQARAARDGSAYTAMVPVTGAPEKVKACGTTNAGYQSCTKPGP